MGRRTGVGITAEGDMIAAMGLRYGTQEATDFSVEVHKTLALAAYRSSVEMAKERGAFEIYDTKREENNPFINRIKEADPQLYEDMAKYDHCAYGHNQSDDADNKRYRACIHACL